ncbi:MAG: beta-ketoacyl-[acyl-carrier-protein] synthase family protein [Rhodanobacteraceae bacterium]
MEEDPIVISGIGALTPIGNSWPATWRALKEGRSGVAPITLFDATGMTTSIAAEVKGFDPADHFTPKRCKRSSRASQLAVVAAREAIRDAGLPEDLTELDAGVIVNCAVSGFAEVQTATEALLAGGPRHVSPAFVPAAITNMPACEVAIDLHAHGPVNASALACASGLYALLEARRWLQAGEAKIVIAGGADASITSAMFAGLGAMRVLSPGNGAPEEASRPFDADRDGFVFGEGAVVFVMERRSHAAARGASAYAAVLGGALTCDGFHIVAPEPSGEYAARAIRRALEAARLAPSEVDYICAHGTSTQANDRTETRAIHQALGAAARHVAVSAPKSMTGHLIGAAGALGALACVLAIRDGVIPPTINYHTRDPACDLDYVPNTARQQAVRHAIANAFGFGGQNCVVAFGKG